jgi:ligand-binding sensor domain-containing protein
MMSHSVDLPEDRRWYGLAMVAWLLVIVPPLVGADEGNTKSVDVNPEVEAVVSWRWARFDQQDGFPVSVQALTSTDSGVLFAGSFGQGIFRTVDRGGTWVSVGTGVTDPFILSLTVGRDGSIYAGTLRGGVFRSRDEGATWQAVNTGLKRLQVKMLMATEDALYAGTGDGVYRFEEATNRWTVVTAGLDDVLVHALARTPDGTLYAGTSGKGVLRYAPHSSGWVRLPHGLKNQDGLIENFIRVLAIDQDNAIWAGTFDGGVFRSTDGGMTWRPISRRLPNDSIRGIVLSGTDVIVATGNGIFKTSDHGKRWVAINKGLKSLSIQTLIVSADGRLYAGTNEGVFRSDDGMAWIAVNQGLEGGPPPAPFRFQE